MYIEERNCKTYARNVTVCFQYEELKYICNGLYLAMESSEENQKKYSDIYGKCKFLFDMVKHGNIQPETLKKLKVEQETI